MTIGYDYSIVDLPTKDGGFPYQTVSLPEGSEYDLPMQRWWLSSSRTVPRGQPSESSNFWIPRPPEQQPDPAQARLPSDGNKKRMGHPQEMLQH